MASVSDLRGSEMKPSPIVCASVIAWTALALTTGGGASAGEADNASHSNRVRHTIRVGAGAKAVTVVGAKAVTVGGLKATTLGGAKAGASSSRASLSSPTGAAKLNPVTFPHVINKTTPSIITGRCKPGFVPRMANGQDHVCVTSDEQQQVAKENAAAGQHTGTRPYDIEGRGPPACLTGYVWRMADAQDHVCVTPPRRTQTAKYNAAALRAVGLTVVTPSQGRQLRAGVQAGGAQGFALRDKYDRAIARHREIKALLSTEDRAALDRLTAYVRHALRLSANPYSAYVRRTLKSTVSPYSPPVTGPRYAADAAVSSAGIWVPAANWLTAADSSVIPIATGAVQVVLGGSSPSQAGTLSKYVLDEIAGIDVGNVGIAQTNLQNQVDSENEVSEMTSMQLQMLMDDRSTLLQTASDIEKTISDTDLGVVGNIKQ